VKFTICHHGYLDAIVMTGLGFEWECHTVCSWKLKRAPPDGSGQ